MSLVDLKQKIESMEARLAVIGLGYVGLPVACAFAEAGFDMLGVDIKAERVEKINAGLSPIEGEEPGLADLLAKVVGKKRLRAISDYQDLADRDIIFIDVETPVNDTHQPEYQALRSGLHSLGQVLQPGMLVIVESTIAPGTMSGLIQPLLEEASHLRANLDFFLGNCPERVMPGKLLANLHSLSRVCGGGTPETAETMVLFYRSIIQAELDPADWITAELVKTVENAYRDVQIAFANEVALICEALGGDVWKVRELVNKSPYRQMHLPGAGVGGHCILKDPWLLVYGIEGKNVPVRLIPAARAVNDGMPAHVADLLERGLAQARLSLQGARILILGYAYLEDSDDSRNSPSEALVKILQGKGVEVVVHDPYVPGYQGDVYEMAQGCEGVVVMVRHHEYFKIDFKKISMVLHHPLLIDGRNLLADAKGDYSGLEVYRIGN